MNTKEIKGKDGRMVLMKGRERKERKRWTDGIKGMNKKEIKGKDGMMEVMKGRERKP